MKALTLILEGMPVSEVLSPLMSEWLALEEMSIAGPNTHFKSEFISKRKYEDLGYIAVKEKVWEPETPDSSWEMTSAFSPIDDGYIGDTKTARFLGKRGIKPQRASEDHNVCSIGFCEKENKWYGWSHRAIAGFGMGDKIFEEKFGNDKTKFVKHGSKDVKTLEDAKLAATRFAGYVS